MKKITKTNIMFTTIILVYIIMSFSIKLIPGKYLSYNMLLVIPELIILLTAIAVCVLLKSTMLKETEFRMVSVGTCIKSVVFAYLCIPLVSVVSAITSGINGNTATNALSKIMDNPLWLSIVLTAVIPALVEEFVFRGLIFGSYKKRNPLKGAILSAFLFGLMHLNINQFSYAFVLGIVLALLAYATGSIWPAIIVHFVINANSVIISYLSLNMEEGKKIAEQASTGATEELTNAIGDTKTIAMIISVAAVIFMVVAATSLAVLLFISICRKNRGIKNVVNIFKKPILTTYNDEGKYFDGYLILGIGICVVFILYFDIIVNL